MIVIVKNLKRIGILLTSSLALVGIASVAFAAPSPGTIATGDSLHIIPVYQPVGSPEMYSVTASGTTVGIGISASASNSWFGASQDPTTGKSYIADGDSNKIWEINPTTGELSNALTLRDGSSDVYLAGMAIAGDGKVYVAYGIVTSGCCDLTHYLGTLTNATTSQITRLYATPGAIFALAINPMSGQLYGGYINGSPGPLMEIDPTAATFTKVDLAPIPNPGFTSIQFDSNGTLWYTSTDEKLCSADINALGTVQCNALSVNLANKDRYPLLRVKVQNKTVTFDANGGAGTMAVQSASTQTALSQNRFTRTGYTFAGWSTTATGTIEYADKANFAFTSSQTLYAQWTAISSNTSATPTPSTSSATPILAKTGTANLNLVTGATALTIAGIALFVMVYRKQS